MSTVIIRVKQAYNINYYGVMSDVNLVVERSDKAFCAEKEVSPGY